MREALEDVEERKRLIEIDKFKADKLPQQLGQKRRRHSHPDLESMQAKKPRIQALTESTKHGILAIEYWPEDQPKNDLDASKTPNITACFTKHLAIEFKPALETPAPTQGGILGRNIPTPQSHPLIRKSSII